MRAILIRHTRVAVPVGVCYGWCDVPLAASWPEDLADVRARLPWRPDEIWTSPAARCRELAMSLGAAAVRIEPRLRELSMGAWEGRPWAEFRGPESEAWALDPWGRSPPGGETAEAMWARVRAVRAELTARGEGRLAVVTHAGVIRAWRGISEGRTLEQVMAEPVPFGSIWDAV